MTAAVMARGSVRCRGLQVRYPNGDWGLRGVDVTFEAGGSTAICGPSGSGKSTLLNTIAGLIRPTAGAVQIDGATVHTLSYRELAALRRRLIGTVFQQGFLLNDLSCLDNVALPLRLLGVRRSAARERAAAMMTRLGLAQLQDRMPWRLSGGQRQRLAVARAVVHQPALILADEPTGSLDRGNAEATLELILAAARSVSGTLVLVTHDERLAGRCERVLAMDDGGLRPTESLG